MKTSVDLLREQMPQMCRPHGHGQGAAADARGFGCRAHIPRHGARIHKPCAGGGAARILPGLWRHPARLRASPDLQRLHCLLC